MSLANRVAEPLPALPICGESLLKYSAGTLLTAPARRFTKPSCLNLNVIKASSSFQVRGSWVTYTA